MANKIYSWRTSKTDKGFSFSVYEISPRKTQNKQGQYADTKTIKYGVQPTRAKAKTLAQKYVRYYNSKK